jgi:hypothetical protein
MRSLLALVLLSSPVFAEDLRYNQIQVIGTHNSYRVAPTKDVLKMVGTLKKEWAEQLDYTHRPFAEQFGELGIRQVELDVYADPDGGKFAKPSFFKLAKEAKLDPGPDPNEKGVFDKPGFKVLHIPDVDYRSHCATFTDGLEQIRQWSKAHPKHLPIMVMIELKEEVVPLLPTKPVKFDAKLLNAIDEEILKVFPRESVFTPDVLRQKEETLPKAIQKHGWPKLDDLRGKVCFMMDNAGPTQRLYLEKHPALKGRVMFCSAEKETDDHAAWFKVNDPVKNFNRIQDLVQSGFIVRTRADELTAEARANDTTRREQAFESGAQFISTDYPEPRKEWSKYCVQLPKKAIARVNPVSAPKAKPIEWEPKK